MKRREASNLILKNNITIQNAHCVLCKACMYSHRQSCRPAMCGLATNPMEVTETLSLDFINKTTVLSLYMLSYVHHKYRSRLVHVSGIQQRVHMLRVNSLSFAVIFRVFDGEMAVRVTCESLWQTFDVRHCM